MILGNSIRNLNPQQKYLIYKSYVLPIALYKFQLWYYNKAPLSYPLKTLEKLQKRAALWIVRAFKTSLSFGIETIASLIVRHGSHQGGSLQNGLGDEQTCGTTLASAYVLCHLSAMWSQLQMKERKSKWK